jgi:hypothetical protein
MKINSYWIKISFSSNPESFQKLAIGIGNSSMFKSRDNDLQNITIKTKDQVTQTPLTRG